MKNFYKELEKLLNSSQLTREQKVQIIKEAGEAYNKQIDNELNNYLAKQYLGAALEIGSAAIPQHKKSKQHLGDWTPTQNSSSENGSFSAPSNSELLDNISIHDYILKNNLPEWLNSKASTGITSAIDNYIKSGSDTNIIKNEESPKILEGRVEKWENINDIKLNKNKIPAKDWTGYKNPLTGDNRIYTAEDIGNMTTKEFGQREKEIDAQINKMGIPRKNDLSVFGGGTIYIAPYTRVDGVQVKGHYRAMR